ncbi:hypothetical protein ACIRL2_30060 [Embleya sp. NPDC127516]|uniref:hypothetical protein n=1 Tax=Embleya sp. NPDC127516 TaxID=3363990 RepID=UPI00381020FA
MTAAGSTTRPVPASASGRPPTARRLGESRHSPARTVLTPLGEVLTGHPTGRIDDNDITAFDSSGIGVQDLYPGLALLKKTDISL